MPPETDGNGRGYVNYVLNYRSDVEQGLIKITIDAIRNGLKYMGHNPTNIRWNKRDGTLEVYNCGATKNQIENVIENFHSARSGKKKVVITNISDTIEELLNKNNSLKDHNKALHDLGSIPNQKQEPQTSQDKKLKDLLAEIDAFEELFDIVGEDNTIDKLLAITKAL